MPLSRLWDKISSNSSSTTPPPPQVNNATTPTSPAKQSSGAKNTPSPGSTTSSHSNYTASANSTPSQSSDSQARTTSPAQVVAVEASIDATPPKFKVNSENVSACYQCDSPFSVLNRRHRCVACTRFFCSKCTKITEASGLRLPKPPKKSLVRICDFCFDTLSLSGINPLQRRDSTIHATRSFSAVMISSTSNQRLAADSALSGNEDSDEEADSANKDDEELLSKTYQRVSFRNMGNLIKQPKEIPIRVSSGTNSSNQPSNLSPSMFSPLSSSPDDGDGSGNQPNGFKKERKPKAAKLRPDRSGIDSSFDSSEESSSDSDNVNETEEENYDKWFSKPMATQQPLDLSIEDPLKQEDETPSFNTPSKKQQRATVESSTMKRNTSSRKLDIINDSPFKGPLSTPLSQSKSHFALNGIALPTTPVVKHIRVVSHSLLDTPNDLANQSTKGQEVQTDREIAFKKMSMRHLQHICDVLMKHYGIEPKWKKKMIALADQAVVTLKLNVRSGDQMDILHYIKFKVIPGGSFTECEYVPGVVFEGNRTSRQSNSYIKNGKLLLLACSIEFERREGVLSSIDKLLQQEKDYLTMLCNKVAATHPNIILVEKSVSFIAREMLEKKGITLMLNVKPHILETVARLSGATIMQSTDHVSVGNVGKCTQFKIETFSGPWGNMNCTTIRGSPELYATVILRGAPKATLQKIKLVLQTLVYSAYNMVMENQMLFEDSATTTEAIYNSANLGKSPSVTGNEDAHPLEYDYIFSPTSSQSDLPSIDSLTIKKPKIEYEGHLIATNWSVSIPDNSALKPQLAPSPGKDQIASQLGFSIDLPPIKPELRHTVDVKTESGTFEVVTESPSLDFSYQSLRIPVEDEPLEPQIPEFLPPPRNARLSPTAMSLNHIRKKRIRGITNFAPQHIMYLHSLYCSSTSTQCVPFTPQIINYYSCNDMTLGQFLENYCFSDRIRCSFEDCHKPIYDHERCIMHANGRLNIAVRAFDPATFFQQSANGLTPIPTIHPGLDKDAPTTITNQSSITDYKQATPEAIATLDPSKILMWANCKKLDRQTPFMIRMSKETWNLSLGKFFELVFYSSYTQCRVCSFPTYREHVRYFYFNNKVAIFEYEPVKAYDISIPPMQLSMTNTVAKKLMLDEIDEVERCAGQLYSTLEIKVAELQDSCNLLDDEEELRAVTIFHNATDDENKQFREIVAKERNHVAEVEGTTIFHVTRLRRLYYLNVRRWSDTVGELELRIQRKIKQYQIAMANAQKEKEKQEKELKLALTKRLAGSGVTAKEFDPSNPNINVDGTNSSSTHPPGSGKSPRPRASSTNDTLPLPPTSAAFHNSSDNSPRTSIGATSTVEAAPGSTDTTSSGSTKLNAPPSQRSRSSSNPATSQTPSPTVSAHASAVAPNYTYAASHPLEVPTILEMEEEDLLDPLGAAGTSGDDTRSANQPPLIAPNPPIPSLPRHTNLGDTTIPPETIVAAPTLRHTIAPGIISTSPAVASAIYSSTKYKDEHVSAIDSLIGAVLGPRKTQIVDIIQNVDIHVFPPNSTSEPCVAVYENEPSSIIAYALMNDRYKAAMQQFEFPPPGFVTDPPASATSANHDSASSSNSHTASVFSLHSSSSSVPNVNNSPHNSFSASTNSGSVSVANFNTNHSTSSHQFPSLTSSAEKLEEKGQTTTLKFATFSPPASSTPNGRSTTPNGSSLASITPSATLSTDPASNPSESSPSFKGLVSPGTTHIDLEWKVTPVWDGPRIQMQCRTYYARQFNWLRHLIGLDEKTFAQSLSRCKPWKARGGKSNSRFARTLDERFILKQIQPIELEAFLAFAPLYFDYFAAVYFKQVPTAICKIVGIFSVSLIRKGKSATKVDLIVQENCFYGHNIAPIKFDLKGSLRSRLARPENPDDKDIVLLDENLLGMMYSEPIAVTNEAKFLLSISVWNDTLCLARLGVMDYSLLVGIDKDSGKLVVGIIDYMRTYTWDKQLETLVKRSGILGGSGSSNIPTIISPKQYKRRFRLAMWAYFLMIPNLNTKVVLVENRARKAVTV